MTATSVSHEHARSESTLRSVFVYGLALVGVMVAASGLAGLLRVVLEALSVQVLEAETDTAVARGLSLTLTGLPVWLLAWRSAERVAAVSATGERAPLRRLYLAVTRLVALSLAAGSAVPVVLWLLAARPFDGGALAWLIVWGTVWSYHERVATRRSTGLPGASLFDRVEVYIAAAAALAAAASWLGVLASRALETVYRAAVDAPVLVGTPTAGPLDWRAATAAAAVAGAAWWWHWLGRARGDAGSRLWLAVVFLPGVLGGAVAALSGGGIALHLGLGWLLRAADEPAVVHFALLPDALAAVVVGAAAWGYHRAHLSEQAALRDRKGPERTYWYLVAGAGLVTAAAGVDVVLGLGLDLAVPGELLVGSGAQLRDLVAVGLTLLIVGSPVWGLAWRHAQRVAATDLGERVSLPRRFLIFVVFGVSALTAISALGVVLFQLFEVLLEGQLSASLVEEQRWSLAALITAGAVSAYYGLVWREDRAALHSTGREQAAGPSPAPAGPAAAAPGVATSALREVVVVDAADSSLVAGLRQRLAVPVVHWVPQGAGGPSAATPDATATAERIQALDAPRVLVLGADKPRLVALADGSALSGR
jgi:hypothetical protein